MQEVLMDILEKASEVLPERLKLIGVDIDKEDILPSTVTPKQETEVTTDENVATDAEKTDTDSEV